MHVAIEATRLLQERRGIGRYVRNVLVQFAVAHPTLRFSMYVRTNADRSALPAHLHGLHPALAARTMVEPIGTLTRTPADVVWYPWNFITTVAPRKPMVVTIHDVAPMLQLDHRWWKLLKRARFRRLYTRTVQQASEILTVSEFSRHEILRCLPANDARITVTPLAADDLRIDGPDALPDAAATVTGPFFLSVGGQEGRKNLATLYEAMALLHARGVRASLVQCGPRLSAQTRRLHGTAPWLTHVGFVNDAQLVTLYRRAAALVMPSRYEGFGLPVLEAMRVGCPVICADASALPEAVGDAARRFAWQDTSALAEHMAALLDSSAERERLITRGAVQVARFSWARVAEQTLMCFRRAANASDRLADRHAGPG